MKIHLMALMRLAGQIVKEDLESVNAKDGKSERGICRRQVLCNYCQLQVLSTTLRTKPSSIIMKKTLVTWPGLE